MKDAFPFEFFANRFNAVYNDNNIMNIIRPLRWINSLKTFIYHVHKTAIMPSPGFSALLIMFTFHFINNLYPNSPITFIFVIFAPNNFGEDCFYLRHFPFQVMHNSVLRCNFFTRMQNHSPIVIAVYFSLGYPKYGMIDLSQIILAIYQNWNSLWFSHSYNLAYSTTRLLQRSI